MRDSLDCQDVERTTRSGARDGATFNRVAVRCSGFQRAMRLLPFAFGMTRVPVAQAADEWRARWRTALALYEQAQYGKACQRLRSVSKEQPKNAAVWADVAACESKLSGASSARALHAARMSIRWGDESIRKKGYLVLGAAGQRLALPSNDCAPLSAPPEAACARKVIACTKSWNSPGSAYSSEGEVVFFGRTRAQAEAQGDGFDPRIENAFDNVLSLNDHVEETCGASCDRAVQAGAAAESALIIKQAQACVQRRPGPFGSNEPCLWQGQRCSDEPSCRATVLKNAAKIRGIAEEVQHFVGKCVTDCQANAEPAGPNCGVVYADGCQGNIGVVCTKTNADGSERTEASEWGIPEPD